MDTLSQKLKRHHIIQDRKTELIIAVLFFVFGSVLLYDAYDARGKKVPWPASVLAPW